MDKESIKQALGDVLASELKVMNEQLSVLPSMKVQLNQLVDNGERMQTDVDVIKITVRKHSAQLAELQTNVTRLNQFADRVEPVIERHDDDIRKIKKKAG